MISNMDENTTEDDLREHFNQLVVGGKMNVVADVAFAYNNRSEIMLYRARGDIVRKKRSLTFVRSLI